MNNLPENRQQIFSKFSLKHASFKYHCEVLFYNLLKISFYRLIEEWEFKSIQAKINKEVC